MGVPAPGLTSALAAVIELVGGIFLLIGAATPWVAVVIALQMLAAYLFAHIGNGVFISNGGFELVGAIAAASLALAAVGAGRFSVDHLLASRRARD